MSIEVDFSSDEDDKAADDNDGNDVYNGANHGDFVMMFLSFHMGCSHLWVL